MIIFPHVAFFWCFGKAVLRDFVHCLPMSLLSINGLTLHHTYLEIWTFISDKVSKKYWWNCKLCKRWPNCSSDAVIWVYIVSPDPSVLVFGMWDFGSKPAAWTTVAVPCETVSSGIYGHFENTPIQIYILKFSPPKTEKFHIKILIFFLFLLKNIDCGYSLEQPRRGGSNEYLQSMFLSRKKEK